MAFVWIVFYLNMHIYSVFFHPTKYVSTKKAETQKRVSAFLWGIVKWGEELQVHFLCDPFYLFSELLGQFALEEKVGKTVVMGVRAAVVIHAFLQQHL